MSALPRLTDSRLVFDEGIATLTFARDDVRNALTGTELVNDLLKVIEWVNSDLSVRVLILTGEGRAFSAGGNVHDMQARQGDFAGDAHELEQRYRQGIQRMPVAMQSLDVPVIAAINGAAVGAGFDLCCMADLRLAAEGASLGETFVHLGIIPGDGGAWFLQRLIGYQRAFELTMTGRVFSSEEALKMGLVLSVHPASELMPSAQDLASRIARQPGRASRYAKRLMQKATRMNLSDFLDQCASFQAQCHEDPEHQAALSNFLAQMASRRKP